MLVEGRFDQSEWRIQAVIGPEFKAVRSAAIQANSDIILEDGVRVDSYDSRVAPYDPASPADKSDIQGEGNFTLENESEVEGNVEVVGTITLEGSADVSGTQTPGGQG